MSLDHDGIFKQLLSAFLVEFLELFAADLLAQIDTQEMSLLPTESFVNLLSVSSGTIESPALARLPGP